MTNLTERARRHKLRAMGIGSSREAVLARRSREIRSDLNQINRGERLPGWLKLASFATPENIDSYLNGLEPFARQKALELMRQESEKNQSD